MLMHTRRATYQKEEQRTKTDRKSAGADQRSGTAVPLYGMAGHFFCDETDRTCPLGYTQESRAADTERAGRPSVGAGPVLQPKLVVGGQEVYLEEPVKGGQAEMPGGAPKPKKKKEGPHSKRAICGAIYKAGFKDTYIEQIWTRLVMMSREAEVYEYGDLNEMIREVGEDVMEHPVEVDTAAKERRKRTAAFYEENAESVFAWLQDNAAYIATQTPEWLFNELRVKLNVEELAEGAGALREGVEITISHQTESSIAGNVIITVGHKYYNFMIEIHPKGGVHYGAYLLVKFQRSRKRGDNTEWKWISSKRSSYLPGGEKRAEEFSEEPDCDILKGERTTSKDQLDYGRKGVNTLPEVKGVALKKMFSKKGMVEMGIWSPKEKADVERYRNRLQARRIAKIRKMPLAERGRMIGLEYGHLEKRLFSLDRESRAEGFHPARKDAILKEVEFILECAAELKKSDVSSENAGRYEVLLGIAVRLQAVLDSPSAGRQIQLDLQEIPYLERRLLTLVDRLHELESRIGDLLVGFAGIGGFARELTGIRAAVRVRLDDLTKFQVSAGDAQEITEVKEKLARMEKAADDLVQEECLFLINRLGFLIDRLREIPLDAPENRLIERESAQIRAEADEMQILFIDVPEVSEIRRRVEVLVRMIEDRRQARLSHMK